MVIPSHGNTVARGRNHAKIEPFLITYFYSKMFQQIESGFVEEEIYCVKAKNGYKRDLIFTHYAHTGTGVWFDDTVRNYGYLLQLNEITIYKYISDEEYWAKVKEKYDAKCLNIVLKRLVNEYFEWS